MSSVRNFVDVIKKEEERVDILINNAGVVSMYILLFFDQSLVYIVKFAWRIILLNWAEEYFVKLFTCLSALEKIFTEEGLELTFATNHFGPFLLTNLLLGRQVTKTGLIFTTPNQF